MNSTLVLVVCWLVILFLSFSLPAPPSATTALSLVGAAISVVVAVLLLLKLGQPLGGFVRISSEPMLNLLNHLAI